MTIRHPANVKIVNKKILSSGVDSLYLSLTVVWHDSSVFSYLDEIKEKAKQFNVDYFGELKRSSSECWPFTVKPHGTKGYSWILIGGDFAFKINSSQNPGPKPSVMIEIRSETLARLGVEESVHIALTLIEMNGGTILETKLSRVDLYVDLLISEKIWSDNLKEYIVSRATDIHPYFRNNQFTGIRIGKGALSSRLYDKLLEITQQSHKTWLYDIWGINEPPQEKKIIRVEFQLRREVLKQLGLNTVHDLLTKAPQTWAYCTQKWLKFQDRPGLHHTQRTTFEWWEKIQSGFIGIQEAEPLVRKKAIIQNKKKLAQLAVGAIVSLKAIELEEMKANSDISVDIYDCLDSFIKALNYQQILLPDIKERVQRKRAKYHREDPRSKN